MNICIAATMQQQSQLMAKGIATTAAVQWVASTDNLLMANADALIDCTYCRNVLPQTNKPFLFHSPIATLAEISAKGMVGRFCAWNTFLQREVWEIAITNDENKTWINKLMNAIGWKFCIVQDVTGLIAPRIAANIINEAFYAIEAGISSKEEINLAMKLGTNYPYGPFEWAHAIGINNIKNLLVKIFNHSSVYYSAL